MEAQAETVADMINTWSVFILFSNLVESFVDLKIFGFSGLCI